MFYIVPPENFPNFLMALLFTIIFLLFLIIELRIFSKNRLSSGNKFDNGSLLLIIIGIILPITISFFLSYTVIGKIPLYWSYVGLFLVLFGFILRQYSIILLGKYFTPVISVNKDKGHNIIKKGPYKYIRHPSYTGLFLEISGLGLFLTNWIPFIASILYLLPTLLYRIKIEEDFLLKEFGKEYHDYMKNTKKLVPKLY